ncbi:zinc ribbon domain-containing protein [Candidatus Leptofilum sp.]|uniref:zinc ribbon domain-containing protein n=1 Tax=Candidatus Leptofilum sp. TaxID=3241576 RepID=UPI003B5C7692
MMNIHQLFQLQKLDTEIDEKKKRLGEVLKAQKEPESLLKKRQRAETAAAELQTWQTKHQDLTLEVGSVTTKAKNSENRLYSGKVTNPKELSDLQQEVESLGRRKALLEDEVLEALVMVEDAQAEKTAADDELETAVADWEKQSTHLKAEQNELALSLHKLMQSRKGKAAAVDAPALNEYEQLRKGRHGLAVAALRINVCQGCRTSVSANKVKEANEGRKVYCGGCGRLLAAM